MDELTHEYRSVGQELPTLAVLNALIDITFVAVSISKVNLPLACHLIVDEGAFIAFASLACEFSAARSSAMDEVTLVNISIWPCQLSFSMEFAVAVIAFVYFCS